jgi:uncharacterized protein YggU (UPF0235/DUF167 family)
MLRQYTEGFVLADVIANCPEGANQDIVRILKRALRDSESEIKIFEGFLLKRKARIYRN